MYAHAPTFKSKPVLGHMSKVRSKFSLSRALRIQVIGEGNPETCAVPTNGAAVELGADIVGCGAG